MTNKWSFIEHATDYILRPRSGDPRFPTLWPSEASAEIVNKHGETQVLGKCRRAIFLRYLHHNYKFYPRYSLYQPLVEEIEQKEIPPDRYMAWIWRAGELYEEYVVQLSKESGVFINAQTNMYVKSHNLSGKIDLTIINPHTHKYSNIEVKSVYGFGGNMVLGTPSARRKGALGTPRDSNLMQIALYEWWNSSADDAYEHSRLVYGARDTGRYAEYTISTETDEETGEIKIFHQGAAPNETEKVEASFTINNILDQYKFVQDSLDGSHIPARDFDAQYSEERIQTLYERKELTKTDTERHEKWLKYTTTGGRKIKPVEKGDWQCGYCKYKNICFDKDLKPTEL